jgi:Flp pilus assembly pilin Flp
MNAMLKTFWRDEDGGEAVEWPLIVALVAIAALAAWGLLGDKIKAAIDTIIAAFTTAGVA